MKNNSIIQVLFKKEVSYFIGKTATYIKDPLDKLNLLTDNIVMEKDFEKQIEIIESNLSAKIYCLNALAESFSLATNT